MHLFHAHLYLACLNTAWDSVIENHGGNEIIDKFGNHAIPPSFHWLFKPQVIDAANWSREEKEVFPLFLKDKGLKSYRCWRTTTTTMDWRGGMNRFLPAWPLWIAEPRRIKPQARFSFVRVTSGRIKTPKEISSFSRLPFPIVYRGRQMAPAQIEFELPFQYIILLWSQRCEGLFLSRWILPLVQVLAGKEMVPPFLCSSAQTAQVKGCWHRLYANSRSFFRCFLEGSRGKKVIVWGKLLEGKCQSRFKHERFP